MRRAGLCLLLISSTAVALPPGSTFREGANHRVGDDSFVAKLHRHPGPRDSEASRMQIHLAWIRRELAAKPATKPALAAKRTELLGYLDDYIAKGITPTNWALPWRTPVFIDDRGAICAVGYLLERSVGRALPERIAATHRYDYLEDIAKLPEVRAWVESSGFTLDELASIQPGYTEPEAHTWQRWFVSQIKDGAYRSTSMREAAAVGRFAGHKMQGEWRTFSADITQERSPRARIDEQATVIGRGTLTDGRGAWTSYDDDGKLLAKGRFEDNAPSGTWRFYHPSGNLAAIGDLWSGKRAGRWEFFHDSAKRTKLATGTFTAAGKVTGTWKHFDPAGKLIAVSHTETPSQWRLRRADPQGNNSDGEVIDIVPGPDRIRHAVSIGTIDGERQRLDTFALGRERLYVYGFPWADSVDIYDPDGQLLNKAAGGWTAAACRWNDKWKGIAKLGDVSRMHGMLWLERVARGYDKPKPTCGIPTPVGEARSKRIDALLESRDKVRSAPPTAIRDLVLKDSEPQDVSDETKASSEDMTKLLVEHMGFYVEWPHIDGRFIQVYRTLPGHVRRYWWDEGL